MAIRPQNKTAGAGRFPPRRMGSVLNLLLGFGVALLHAGDGDGQVVQLLVVHYVGAGHHQVRGVLHLGEGDDVTDGGGPGHEHAQPVQAIGQAAVGGRAELEGVDQVAKALLNVLLADAQGLEGLLLHLGGVDADGAAAQLHAVEHDVIGPGAAVGLVGEDKILTMGAVKGWCMAI